VLRSKGNHETKAGFYDRVIRQGTAMPIARVREVAASSRYSFQDAIEQGVSRALATYSDIQGVVVQEQKVLLEDSKIACYRVTLKVFLAVTD
jgi:flavin-binding protein dodecin